MKSLGCAALVAATVLAFPAEAAREQYVGKWNCQIASQPGPAGSKFDLWMYTFEMNVVGQGTFTAKGTYEAATNGYADPFTVDDGTWTEEPDAFVGKGNVVKKSGNLPMIIAGTLQADGTMSYKYTSPQGTMLFACKR